MPDTTILAPRCHAKDRQTFKEMMTEYAEFLARYVPLSGRLRAGDLSAAKEFPEGCFPPSLPFVGGFPPPPRRPPPPTRVVRKSESGGVVHRGPVPLVIVPALPGSRGQPI